MHGDKIWQKIDTKSDKLSAIKNHKSNHAHKTANHQCLQRNSNNELNGINKTLKKKKQAITVSITLQKSGMS